MDTLTTVILAIPILLIIFVLLVRRSTIYEYQCGLLYTGGRFKKLLKPGEHYYFRLNHAVHIVDTRIFYVTLPGQEVLSADNVGIKISLAAAYRVVDPDLAVNKVFKYQEALYLLLQMNLRDLVGSLAIDDLLAKREAIGKGIFEKSVPQAAEIGIELSNVNIKDIMFPGELKNIFAQVVSARKEGLAALERARGESAALRNLANAESLFDNHPYLMQLRLIQALEQNSSGTLVVLPSEGRGINDHPGKTGGKK